MRRVLAGQANKFERQGVVAADQLQQLLYLRGDNAQGVLVLLLLQFVANLFQDADDALPLFGRHEQGLAGVVGEESGEHQLSMVVGDAATQLRVPQQFGVEEQRPALGMDFLARVGLAANLSRRHAHQGMLVERVAYLSVGKFLQFLVANEQGIDIVVVQRVAAVLQLVVVNHRDERVQFRCPDVAGVVVDGVYL